MLFSHDFLDLMESNKNWQNEVLFRTLAKTALLASKSAFPTYLNDL